jgi:hypothetical protein
LLAEVKLCFTDEDSDKLAAPSNKAEIKKVLDSCRPHAAPGTDGITVFFYKTNWDIIGDSLVEVIQAVFNGPKPSSCQRTSLIVFGNKPEK